MGLASIVTALVAATAIAPAGHIVTEWEPGIDEAELGGALVVDTYGVDGLGAYGVRLDDGTTTLAVCIQADVGHVTTATYRADPDVALPAELAYLLWAYLRPGATATDEQAAAVNALAWRYTGAQRRTGGSVWQGDHLEVRVLGVGRLTAVEQAIAALHAEAVARRGPWTLEAFVTDDGEVRVAVHGPGGPIAGVSVGLTGDDGEPVTVTTDAAGVAGARLGDGVRTVRARVAAPGPAVALVAPGSQRLAMPGQPAELTAAVDVPATTTSIVTTTSIATTTSIVTTTTIAATTSAPATSATSTTATSTTAPSTTSTTVPPTPSRPAPTTTSTTTSVAPPADSVTTVPPTVPPTLPRTGLANRAISRLAAVLFLLGALALAVATPRRA